MISGVDRPVLLDIARMAAARVAIDRLTFVVALLLFIESVLTLAVFPDASINPPQACCRHHRASANYRSDRVGPARP